MMLWIGTMTANDAVMALAYVSWMQINCNDRLILEGNEGRSLKAVTNVWSCFELLSLSAGWQVCWL